MKLKEYQRKRNFTQTPEPQGAKPPSKAPKTMPLRKAKSHQPEIDLPKFVVQMHAATRLHFDLRLEWNGVLKSWAVPKRPSLNPSQQRLAVHVEDHPLDYGKFEGTIPPGNYGAGAVIVWDHGTYLERTSEDRAATERAMQIGYEKGHLTFLLSGKKLNGEFALIRLKKGNNKNWLLVKKRDQFASYKAPDLSDESVISGRTIEDFSKAPKRPPVTREVTKAKMQLPKGPVTKMPRRVGQMNAVARRELPVGSDWIFETESPGTRLIAEVDGRKVNLYSKSFLSLTARFPNVAKELASLKARVILDGTIDADQFKISDLLFLETDLREKKLIDRLKALETLMKGAGWKALKHVRRTKTFKSTEELQNNLQTAPAEDKAPVILAKQRSSTYASGVSADWVKSSLPIQRDITAPSTQKPTSRQTRDSEQQYFTNLDKIFWPQEKITKGDVINYYREVADVMLPHLIDRPQSLNRHPNGITAKGFFQKDMSGYHPRFLQTHRVSSRSSARSIDYALCQNKESLLYFANLGCIEINPWLSRIQDLDHPDWIIVDLDPDDNSFETVVQVALSYHRLCEKLDIEAFCKTSGATGLHIYLPTGARYTYEEGRDFALALSQIVHSIHPTITSLERSPARRRHKIYLDCFQNARGQTIAAPYCLRPRPGATVSTPLHWREVKAGLRSEKFDIYNVKRRLDRYGDIWKDIFKSKLDLGRATRTLQTLQETGLLELT